MEKISIIVPIYKVETYLKRCVDSILVQTYQNTEIILVDDGSPDKCGAICDAYAEKDERVIVIHKENGGLADARNAGLDIATGAYITFVDSDDYIAPNMCERLYAALKDAGADMCIGNFLNVYESDHTKDAQTFGRDGVFSAKEIFICAANTKAGPFITSVVKLYKRSLFDSIRFPKGKLHEDVFVYYRLLLKANKIAGVSDVLYFYVQREGSIMRSRLSIRNIDAMEGFADCAETLQKEGLPPATIHWQIRQGLAWWRGSYPYIDLKNAAHRERCVPIISRYKRIIRHLLFKPIGVKAKMRALLFLISARLYGNLPQRDENGKLQLFWAKGYRRKNNIVNL